MATEVTQAVGTWAAASWAASPVEMLVELMVAAMVELVQARVGMEDAGMAVVEVEMGKALMEMGELMAVAMDRAARMGVEGQATAGAAMAGVAMAAMRVAETAAVRVAAAKVARARAAAEAAVDALAWVREATLDAVKEPLAVVGTHDTCAFPRLRTPRRATERQDTRRLAF